MNSKSTQKGSAFSHAHIPDKSTFSDAAAFSYAQNRRTTLGATEMPAFSDFTAFNSRLCELRVDYLIEDG